MDYFLGVRSTLSPRYTAEDVYVGNYAGALEALDAGVTTILDFSHCNNTPEHADRAIEGLREAGHPRDLRLRLLRAAARRAALHLARRCASRTPGACSASSTRSRASLITMGISLTEPGLIPFERHQAGGRDRA